MFTNTPAKEYTGKIFYAPHHVGSSMTFSVMCSSPRESQNNLVHRYIHMPQVD